MRAPFKRQVKSTGAKWLRNRVEGCLENLNPGSFASQYMEGSNQDSQFAPPKMGVVRQGRNHEDNQVQNSKYNEKAGIDAESISEEIIKGLDNDSRVIVIDTKNCRTDDGLGFGNNKVQNNEVVMELEREENMIITNEGPKNISDPKSELNSPIIMSVISWNFHGLGTRGLFNS